VTIYVLGDAVEYNVGTLEERGRVEWGKEGVVYEDEGSGWVGSGEADNSWDVHQSKGRICGRLDPDKFGIGAESRKDGVVILVLEIHIRTGDTLVLACDALNVPVCSTIDIVDADNVGIRAEGVNHRGGGCRARSKSETVGAALDSCKGGLESIPVGVTGARILKSLKKWIESVIW